MPRLFYATLPPALAIVTIHKGAVSSQLALQGKNVRCVAVDPSRPELVYSGTSGEGVWRSRDGGETWMKAGAGISHNLIQSIRVGPPLGSDRFGTVYAGTEPSAVYRSPDAGETWLECPGLTALPSSSQWSFPPRPETHHVRWIEPDLTDPRRLYVAIEAGALIRSPDGGQTWVDRTPTGPIDTHQLAVHPSRPERLCSAAGDGYFESNDRGDTWEKHESGLAHRYVWSIAIDAGDANNVLISSAASPRHSHGGTGETYIYRRVNGRHWKRVKGGLPSGEGRRTAVLAADPSQAGHIYAAWGDDMFASEDGGHHWTAFNLFTEKPIRTNENCPLVLAP